MRRSRLLLVLGFAGYIAIAAWLVTYAMLMIASDSGDPLDLTLFMINPLKWRWQWMIESAPMAIPIGLLIISQILFVLPLVFRRPMKSGRAGSLKLSMVMAAFVAALLTCGLFTGLIALCQLIVRGSGSANTEGGDIGGGVVLWTVLLAIPISWIVWSIALIRFCRRNQGRGVFERIMGRLFGGTIIEAIVVLPLDIMLRRKTDCFCAVGSFWSLVLSAWALIWLTGPGIVLALTSKRRRLWWETHCINCGYAKGPSPGANCPECGHAWGTIDPPILSPSNN